MSDGKFEEDLVCLASDVSIVETRCTDGAVSGLGHPISSYLTINALYKDDK